MHADPAREKEPVDLVMGAVNYTHAPEQPHRHRTRGRRTSVCGRPSPRSSPTPIFTASTLCLLAARIH